MTDDPRYHTSGLHGNEAKEHWRQIRTEDLAKACQERQADLKQLTEYQYRVAGKIDFYPTNGNWHNLVNHQRGSFHTIHDIYKLLNQIGYKRVTAQGGYG